MVVAVLVRIILTAVVIGIVLEVVAFVLATASTLGFGMRRGNF